MENLRERAEAEAANVPNRREAAKAWLEEILDQGKKTRLDSTREAEEARKKRNKVKERKTTKQG